MRPCKRPKHAPKVLKDHGPEWTKQWLSRRAAGKAKGKAATWFWPVVGPTSRHYDPARPRLNHHLVEPLLAMTQVHCAFCDGNWKIPTSDPTVEHFRPKSHDSFAHLAMVWENLFPACVRCQTRKRERWSDSPSPLAPDEAFRFADHFRFGDDGHLDPLTERAKATEKLYKLNDKRLKAARVVHREEWHALNKSGSLDLNAQPYRDFLEGPCLSPAQFKRKPKP